MQPLITLTTDFGRQDAYAAAMKGVILRLCPEARIEDLTHEMNPHDVWDTAFFVAGAAPWFPDGTIHVAVVDPGVGSPRRPVAVCAGNQYFVGPDNGWLTLLMRDLPITQAHEITNPAFMLPEVSRTFHGRDVFAPAAARLAAGATLGEAGPAVDRLVLLDIGEPKRGADGSIEGEILHVDRFGNAVSNIHARLLTFGRGYTVHAAGIEIAGISSTYADGAPGAFIALIGSGGYLEIAINQGDAARALGIHRGVSVLAMPSTG